MIKIISKDISNLASIKTSSYAKYFVKCNTINELKEVSFFAKKNNLKLQIIGNGTNILFSKKIYNDIIFLKLGKSFNHLIFKKHSVEIGAAYAFFRAGKKLIDMGYRDFIYMNLIPGSIGGGVVQNAGTRDYGEVKNNFLSAYIYDFYTDEVLLYKKNDMNFNYRDSIIKKESNRYLILSVEFLLGDKVDNIKKLKDDVEKIIKQKRSKEPKGYSFGSTFKNGIKPAWKCISDIGMCGNKIGGAKFSEKHCNWIINYNQASGDDVLNLIKLAKENVYKKLNIKLEEEVVIV